ncbi:hypothetical protein KKG71_02620 [Patescibacteria group bacterium]|nr:hypothetical protein [Patescibacteria group bacterium]
MKKIIYTAFICTIIIGFTACTNNNTAQPIKPNQPYMEWQTNFPGDFDMGIGDWVKVEEEIKRLQNEGATFRHISDIEATGPAGNNSLNYLKEYLQVHMKEECPDCRDIRDIKIGKNNNPNMSVHFEAPDGTIYSYVTEGNPGMQIKYRALKNSQEYFSSDMTWGASDPISKAGEILGKFTFEYVGYEWEQKDEWIKMGCEKSMDELVHCQVENKELGDTEVLCKKETEQNNKCDNFKKNTLKNYSNIYLDGETLNEKYNVEGSRNIFAYKDKIGFIAGHGGELYIFYNGKKISQNFSRIRTQACCAIVPYPFNVYKNGILFFMAKRGDGFYFFEIDLNEYV